MHIVLWLLMNVVIPFGITIEFLVMALLVLCNTGRKSKLSLCKDMNNDEIGAK